ncbi:hypothetical protein FHW89_003054 [Mucilaginibacter sp. SG564]|nr:hypothetical protein [Mucilaginibacter sp. SG564]
MHGEYRIFIAPFPGDKVQKAKMAAPKGYFSHLCKNRSVLVSF